MGRLFGTDGVRGIANTELTAELAIKIGRAAAVVLAEKTRGKPKVLIGTDTRISADMLTGAIAAGLSSVGADVLKIGVVPTPAVAYLVRIYDADAGVMISASHNPCEYNGIKIFDGKGYKLPDETEERIEDIILDETFDFPHLIGGKLGSVRTDREAVHRYAKHIGSLLKGNFSSLKIAFDCANGSASTTVAEIFGRSGADCRYLSTCPDGVNINRECGSTHMAHLQNYVTANGCDLGFAFDGDADRILAVDHLGRIIDGDRLMAVLARHMKNTGTLANNTLVTTIMSNMGLFAFAEKYGIATEKTKVGDRYVLENMLENSHNLGGEQSGHIIFTDHSTTGDGQLSAVMLLNCLYESGEKLAALAEEMEIYPQELINVKVSAYGKLRLNDDEEIKTALEEASHELAENGRVLVRASGTEPLVRVMVEGRDAAKIKRICSEIAEIVRERLI